MPGIPKSTLAARIQKLMRFLGTKERTETVKSSHLFDQRDRVRNYMTIGKSGKGKTYYPVKEHCLDSHISKSCSKDA